VGIPRTWGGEVPRPELLLDLLCCAMMDLGLEGVHPLSTVITVFIHKSDYSSFVLILAVITYSCIDLNA